MCKEHIQRWKETALEEDGEVMASSRHSKKPVSSEEFMCKDHCQGWKEPVLEEDGEVGASSLHSKKP
eukprot:8339326-Ditylum_brightwellii.AAC.1